MTTLLYCTKKNLLSFIYGIATVFSPSSERKLYTLKRNMIEANKENRKQEYNKLSRIF